MKTASITTQEHIRMLSLAVKVASLGGRPTVITRNLPHFSQEEAIAIYRDVTGQNPPKGQLPTALSWYTNPMIPPQIIQSSMMAGIWFATTGDSHIERMITAYETYRRHFEAVGIEPLLAYDRADVLVRYLENRVLRLAPCQSCKSLIVRDREDVALRYSCPCCRGLHSIKKPGARKTPATLH